MKEQHLCIFPKQESNCSEFTLDKKKKCCKKYKSKGYACKKCPKFN